jgi:hypothetical protein
MRSAEPLARSLAMARSQPLGKGEARELVRPGAEKLCDSRPRRTRGRQPLLRQQTAQTNYVYRQQQEMQTEYRGEPSKDAIGNERDVAKHAKNAQEAHILRQER